MGVSIANALAMLGWLPVVQDRQGDWALAVPLPCDAPAGANRWALRRGRSRVGCATVT